MRYSRRKTQKVVTALYMVLTVLAGTGLRVSDEVS